MASSRGKSAFPLLSLLAELRLQVYDQLVVEDQSTEDFIISTRQPKIDWSLLRVCKQTRGEIIHHALRNNIWVRLTLLIPGRTCQPSEMSIEETRLQRYLQTQSCVPLAGLSQPENELFTNNCSLTFTIKQVGSPESDQCHTHDFQFAFDRCGYSQFCERLTMLEGDYTVELSIPPGAVEMITSRPLMVADIAENLLEPLSTVGGLTRISSQDENLRHIFGNRLAGIRSHYVIPSECNRLLQKSITNGDLAMMEDPSMAIFNYSSGLTIAYCSLDHYTLLPTPLCMEGGNEHNTMNLLLTDLYIKLCDALNKIVVRRIFSNGKFKLNRYLTERAIEAGEHAFHYVGISDQQRQAAYCARGMANFNDAIYHESLAQKIKRTKSKRKYLELVPLRYEQAARDFFYALDLPSDPPVSRNDLTQLYESACIKAGQPSMQFPIHEEEVPLIGKWRGQPSLRNVWTPTRFRFMRMMRQSELEGYPPVRTDLSLLVAYENLDSSMSFTRDEDGRLFLPMFVDPGMFRYIDEFEDVEDVEADIQFQPE